MLHWVITPKMPPNIDLCEQSSTEGFLKYSCQPIPNSKSEQVKEKKICRREKHSGCAF